MSEYEPYEEPAHEEPAAEYPADDHHDTGLAGAIGQPLYETGQYDTGHEDPTGYEPGHEDPTGYEPGQYDAGHDAPAGYPAAGGGQEPGYASDQEPGHAGTSTSPAGEGQPTEGTSTTSSLGSQ